MVSSASQSPVSTSIGPPSTISWAADRRSPKNPLQLAIRIGSLMRHRLMPSGGCPLASGGRHSHRSAQLVRELDQGVRVDRLADLDEHLRDDAVHVGQDPVLHLHGLEQDEHLPCRHGLARPRRAPP